MATLIIVSGPSASGKSTLADRLAVDLKLPVIHRDRIKEAMFDTLGYSDRQQSKKFGIAAAVILVREMEDMLKVGASCIVEGKFMPKSSNEELKQLLEDTGADAIQIQCSCDGEKLYERFKQRALSSERHPGHDEANNLEDFKDELIVGKLPYLELSEEALEYDTSERDEVRYETLLEKIRLKISDNGTISSIAN